MEKAFLALLLLSHPAGGNIGLWRFMPAKSPPPATIRFIPPSLCRSAIIVYFYAAVATLAFFLLSLSSPNFFLLSFCPGPPVVDISPLNLA
jgi:hypothetical protein